jgi:ABC-type sugar transport system, periplasmic component
MLFGTILSGCGTKNGSDQTTVTTAATNAVTNVAQTTETAGGEGNLPLSKDLVELRVLTFDNWYAPKNYNQNLPVWQEIEKRTNVKVKWELTPNSQLKDLINTVFASGQDLPDIIFGWFDFKKEFNAGLTLDLTKLIEDNAPNIKKLFADMPSVKGLLTESDGKIIRLSQVCMTDDMQPALLYRQDWLEKLGKNPPTTLDEMEDVLKAIKDGDPNGNGQKDEIPFIFKGLDWLWLPAASFNCYPDFSDGEFYPNKDGVVEFVSTQDSFKAYLQFLNKLYKEGLLSQEFATIPNEKIDSLRNNNQIGMTPNWISNVDTYNKQMPDAKWNACVPPAGPYGAAHIQRRVPLSGSCVLTKDCKDPVLAIKWLDYIWASPDGITLNNFGVEGLSYTVVNGKPVPGDFLTKNPDGLSYSDAIRSIGGQWNLPQVQGKDLFISVASDTVIKANDAIKAVLSDAYPGMYIPKTDSEQATVDQYYNDIKTYRDEMVLKFIMGKADINTGWDSYVKKFKDLGIDKLLADQQIIYKRYIASTR